MSDSSSSSAASSSATPDAIPAVPAGHTQLYVKNLAFATTDETLSEYVKTKVGVAPHAVNIVTTKRPGKFQGRSRGFGFITIVDAQAQKTISALNGVELEGRVLSVVEAKPRDPQQPRERPPREPKKPKEPKNNNNQNNNNSNNNQNNNSNQNSNSESSSSSSKPERKTFPDATQLYVNNLSFETTAEELSTVFQNKTGVPPLDVDIVKSRFGKFKDRSRGFGFVFVSNSVLNTALTLDKTSIADREIGVQIAKPQEDNTNNNNNNSSSSSSNSRPRRFNQRRRRNNSSKKDGDDNNDNSNNDNQNTNDAPDNRRRKPRGGGANNNNNHSNNNNNNNGDNSKNEQGGNRGRGRNRRRGRGGRGGGGGGNSGNSNNGNTTSN